MSLSTDQGGAADEYEAVTLPTRNAGAAVFLRRSTRPSRRAVLHLHELAESLAPADLVRWYNERGFHFYLTDVSVPEHSRPSRRRPARPQPLAFDALDAACEHLRRTDGIDAIILSAQGTTALAAAQWCDARPVSRPVEALILSNPDFSAGQIRLDIACPVLVISSRGPVHDTRRERRGNELARLGPHVTWLHLEASAGTVSPAGPVPKAGPLSPASIGSARQRRRLFDEMGRWLGAYMYGQLRDQLL